MPVFLDRSQPWLVFGNPVELQHECMLQGEYMGSPV